jgi:hypothetical protein
MSHGMHTLSLCGVMAIAATFAANAADGGARQYHVTDLIVGSVVPQTILSGPLPFDSTYATLTPAEKAVLFDDYEGLAPGDEPPYPLFGLRHLVKPLVTFAETWNPVGPLVAAVDVDSKGNAVDVTIYKSPDAQVSRIARGALAFETYKPALCKGQPCRMQYVLHLDFPQRQGMPVQELAFKNYDQVHGDFTRR